MKVPLLDEEKRFEETLEKMFKRIGENVRKAETWSVATTSKFLEKEEPTVRRMIAEGKIYSFKNFGTHEIHVDSVIAYLRHKNGVQ